MKSSCNRTLHSTTNDFFVNTTKNVRSQNCTHTFNQHNRTPTQRRKRRTARWLLHITDRERGGLCRLSCLSCLCHCHCPAKCGYQRCCNDSPTSSQRHRRNVNATTTTQRRNNAQQRATTRNERNDATTQRRTTNATTQRRNDATTQRRNDATTPQPFHTVRSSKRVRPIKQVFGTARLQ